MSKHPNTDQDLGALLTMIETAQRLRSSRSTVYELLERGELASLHVGRRRFVTVKEVDRYIADRLAAEAEGRSA